MCHMQSFLKHLPPGQPVPRFNKYFCEEIPPDVHHEPLLAQPEAMSSCPVTCCLGEEIKSHLEQPPFQVGCRE